MSTATIEKIKKEIKQELLREFILPMLGKSKDSEGEYKEGFIKRVLKIAKEKPKHKYNSKNFLKLVG